jgi:serine/threonine protein kinase
MVGSTLDLTPQGVPHIIRAGFDFKTIKVGDLRKGSRSLNSDRKTDKFTINGIDYAVLEELGEGTYGIAYKTQAPDGKKYAIKYIKDKLSESTYFIDFLKECIIQILVTEFSKDQTNGPFCPRILDICYDETKDEGYVRSELMINTLDNLVGIMTPEQNNVVVPDALKQIAIILGFLQKELKFNHRDMKGDNIMYARSGDVRTRAMKLIDFGMSCLTWQGMVLSGSTWFDARHSCFKKDRDMAQLVYYIQRYQGSKLSPALLSRLQRLILANVGRGHKCEMEKLCPVYGLTDWKSVYDFVDRSNVRIPTGTPEFVEKNMARFMKSEPFVSPSPIAEPKGICLPGYKRNPKTGRCIKDKDGAPLVGVAAGAAAVAAAPCALGKIRNPLTRRCVKADGKVAKKFSKKARRDL